MEFFNSLDLTEKIFLVSAVAGGVIFGIRTFLMLIGANADVDLADTSGEFDGAGMWISVQAISAFLLMFGLIGLTCSVQFGCGKIFSVVTGSFVGFLTIFLLRLVSKSMHKLENDGSQNLNNAVGKIGEIYLTIPANGKGKVQVSFQGSLQIVDAVSFNHEEIKTGEAVTVTEVFSESILKVNKIIIN